MRPLGFNQPNVQNNQGNQSRYQGNNFNSNQNRGNNFNQNHQNNQGQVFQPPTNQPPVYQVPPYQAPTPQIQGVSKTDFENYVKANDAVLKNVQNQGQNLQNQMANVTSLLTSLCNNFKNSASTSNSGTLPRQTITNRRQQINTITTRSGKTLEGPSTPLIPTPDVSNPSKEPEQNPKTSTEKVQKPSSENTAQVPPPEEEESIFMEIPKPKAKKIVNVEIQDLNSPRPNSYQSKLPYPERMKVRENDKPSAQHSRFLKMFKQLRLEIGLKDALVKMPKFNKWLSSLLRNKEKLEEIAITTVNAECSAIIMNKVPEKLKDPGKFLIPCALQELDRTSALADFGASINLLPHSIYKKLGLEALTPTRMTLKLASRSITHPMGITDDVVARVDGFTFLADFVVVNFEPDPRVPIILGRPFLRTAKALIDLYEETLTLRVGKEELVYYADKSEKNKDKHFVHAISVIDFSKDDPFSGSTTTHSDDPSPSSSPVKTSDNLEEFADELTLLKKDIKNSNVSDEPVLLNTPLSDKVECFAPEDDNDEIDAFLAMEVSSNFEEGYFDSEGDVTFLDNLLSDDASHNLASEVISDHEPEQNESSITFSPRSDPLHHEFAGEVITLPSRNDLEFGDNLSLMTVLCEISTSQSQENVHANQSSIIESLPVSPIPVEDSETAQVEIDIFLVSNDLIPPGVENDDSKDEDNELPNLDHQDDPSIPRTPPEPPDVEKYFKPEAGILIIKVFKGVSKPHDFMADILPTLPTLVLDLTFILFLSSFLSFGSEDTIFDPAIRWQFSTTGKISSPSPPQIDHVVHGCGDSLDGYLLSTIALSIQKKEEEKQIAEEQAAKDRYWKIPICYDDDEYDTIGITPVLPIKEPDNNLIEGIHDKMCDVPLYENTTHLNALNKHSEIVVNFLYSDDDNSSSDDDSTYGEDIDYVDASPPDVEIVSLEGVEIVDPEVGRIDDDILLTIKDDILREKLLNANLLIAKIDVLRDNPTPSSEVMTKSTSTFPNLIWEKTNTFDNSIPESETFRFNLEEISSGSPTTHSELSLPDYKAFYIDNDHFKEKSSGSTTTHVDFSQYDSFIFDVSNDQIPNADRSDPYHEEFADELTHIMSLPNLECFKFKVDPDLGNLTSIDLGIRKNVSTTNVNVPLEGDHYSLFAYVVWILLLSNVSRMFFPSPHIFSPHGNEDAFLISAFSIYHSFMPDVSHRNGTFMNQCLSKRLKGSSMRIARIMKTIDVDSQFCPFIHKREARSRNEYSRAGPKRKPNQTKTKHRNGKKDKVKDKSEKNKDKHFVYVISIIDFSKDNPFSGSTIIHSDDPSPSFSPVKTSDNLEEFADELILLKKDIQEGNFQVHSNPLFEFDDNFKSSTINPLFDELEEDVKIKNSNVSDEPVLLNTPLSDKVECFAPEDDNDEIDAFLAMEVSSKFKEVISDHEPEQNESSITFSPKSDPLHHEFAGEAITLPSRNDREFEDYLNCMTVLCEISTSQSQENVHANQSSVIESFLVSHIPVEDSEPTQEDIDIFHVPDDLIPPSVENDDSEDEDNELPNLDHQDDPSIPRPPPKPLDVEKCFEPEAGILITKVFKGVSKTHDFMADILPTLPTLVSNLTFILFLSLFLSFGSEDTIFDPGISTFHFSFKASSICSP
ncbi:reverse transcriptase domain-containing protein [Tanacetum coccineum]